MTARALAGGAAVLGLVAAAGFVITKPAAGGVPDSVAVRIDASAAGAPISPLIRGINGDWSAEEMIDAGIELVSWGGNPNSRFNYQIGHAWNTAADYEFRNVNYTETEGDAVREYIAVNTEAGAETRLAVPTLGWIARNDDLETCSFPDGSGGCEPATATCESPGRIANPLDTSIESTPAMVAEWIAGLRADGVLPRIIAMDNEPDLWGHTHYDVHPECTTFEEVLDNYVSYARAIRAVAPESELAGPVICCWYDFWHPSVEPADGTDIDFMSWFLRGVRDADESFGQRTLDVVDVHYYPQSDVFNDVVDAETSARRLRSTRSLWDPDYVDESWIDETIRFIPRMRETIESEYPGTPLAITEWNFGAEETINGALAIADVLGIFGREGVYAAAYWRSPEPASPGFFAFRMHGNYDGAGTPFEGAALTTATDDVDVLAAYAALESSGGTVRVMLINKRPDAAVDVDLVIDGLSPATTAQRYSYGPADPTTIVHDEVDVGTPVSVPASTIVVIELTASV